MQKIQLIGRLGRNAEIGVTKKGTKFLKFTMATNLRYNGAEEASWWDVVQYRYNENMVQYLTKGSMVNVYGDLRITTEEGKDGKTYVRRNVYANNVEFAEVGNGSGTTKNTTQTITERSEKQVQKEEEKINMYASKQQEERHPINNYVSVEQDEEDDNDLPF